MSEWFPVVDETLGGIGDFVEGVGDSAGDATGDAVSGILGGIFGGFGDFLLKALIVLVAAIVAIKVL